MARDMSKHTGAQVPASLHKIPQAIYAWGEWSVLTSRQEEDLAPDAIKKMLSDVPPFVRFDEEGRWFDAILGTRTTPLRRRKTTREGAP